MSNVTALREPVTRVAVDVTFLRMDAPPEGAAPPLPERASVVRVARCSGGATRRRRCTRLLGY